MPIMDGWGTLGPFYLPKKLKEAFKDLYKGKIEERLGELVKSDVEKINPNWDKVDQS